MKHRVFVTMKHPGDAWNKLVSNAGIEAASSESIEPISKDELMRGLEDADGVVAVIPDRMDAAVFERFPQLKVVANVAVGYDNIDVGRGECS